MASLMRKLFYIGITAIPIVLWGKLFQAYRDYKKEMFKQQQHHKKHNCVVFIGKETGMFGWPEYPERKLLSLSNFAQFHEPIIYFINTAERRLDMAIMIFFQDDFTNALKNALERGVEVRLILDARYYNPQCRQLKSLLKKGANILFDTKGANKDSIMHCKYIVKDYNPDNKSGFSLCASMNFTQSAICDNYECLVFSTNSSMATALNANFSEAWEFLQQMKQSTLFK